MRVQGLAHSYDGGRTRVLDEVGLELRRGAVTGLIGANGAGKSTLLSAMARLLVPDSGQVLLDGLDISTLPPREVATRLAVLRQDARVTARLTVIDLVRFGRFPHSKGRLTPRDHQVVAECLSHTGLEPFRDRYLDELSGGQRQRAFIAMVLAQETEYVLLDEPLNNLDMEHAAATMRLLRLAADDLGRTVVLVLHDVNVAAATCDVIVGMRDGAIVAQGTSREVVSEAGLRKVFGFEIPVREIDGMPVALHWIGSQRLAPPAGLVRVAVSAAEDVSESGGTGLARLGNGGC